MTYARSTYWDHFFHRRRQAGTDLDWGDQWTAVFGPILQAYRVQTLLDLGCGSGNDVRRLAQLGFAVVGLDYAKAALNYAATKAGPSARFVCADMAAGLPFRAACLDAVMANVSIHMFSDALTRALVQDVHRILRPSGLFVFHVNALEDRALRAQRKGPPRELEPNYVLEADGQTMHFFSDDYLRDLLREWRDVRLEFVEIASGTRNTHFKKCVWRGIAQV
jgi:SAM-dependent methyltransferase